MSTPTMNHGSHTQQQQQTDQQQQINETQIARSNSVNLSHATLTRSDSTSTVILEEDETRTCHRNGTEPLPPTLLASLSAQLHLALKTGGRFSNNMENSDKWKELLASGNSFTLQRLLSEIDPKDLNLNPDDLLKFDSFKLDTQALNDLMRSESFDQLLASMAATTDGLANNSSTTSFSELRSVSPEFTTFHVDSTTLPVLNAIEHDHAFLAKRSPFDESSSSSATTTTTTTTTKTVSKRTPARGSRRVSSRIQSRAVCTSTTNDNPPAKNKRTKNINRANDVETPDDLNYYLERRRKNNEASKVSRAVRKQKFDVMDEKCDEYERVNNELITKISILERVTSSLKSGLVNNFQRKN